MSDVRRRVTALLLVGGIAAVVSAKLDWSGVSFSSGIDRSIAAGAGVVAALLALLGLLLKRSWPRVVACLPGLVAIDMAVVNMQDVAGHHYEFAAFPAARIGAGLYVLFIGGAMILGCGVASGWLAFRDRSRRTCGGQR